MKKQIVTDIGGVLIPESFSKKTLMQDFEQNGPEFIEKARDLEIDLYDIWGCPNGVAPLVRKIGVMAGKEKWITEQEAVDYVVQQLMAKNKDPLFLDLMGRVNLASLKAGKVKVDYYPDVPGALARWCYNGQKVHTYSNGSAGFQEAMFKAASCGDLSHHISTYFDTAIIGRKTEADSYKRIAEMIGSSTGEIEYLSDDTGELEAACKAGCKVFLVDREDKHKDLPRLTSLI